MICIDLTSTEEDNILCWEKSKNNENFDTYAPIELNNNNNTNDDIINFFYGTEDHTEKYLSIQHPISRKLIKTSYTVTCPKCHETFINCNFLNHIIDHYKIEYSPIDQLLMPRHISISSNWTAIFNDTNPIQRPSKPRDFRCDICFVSFDTAVGLGQHLESKHVHRDMPYVCFVCNLFRTSFLSSLKQHFYDRHKSSDFLICPLCIESFQLSIGAEPLISCHDKGVTDSGLDGGTDNGTIIKNNKGSLLVAINGSDGYHGNDINVPLNATDFVVHLEKHLLKRQFSCDKCLLKFTMKAALVFHKIVYHQGRDINPNESAAMTTMGTSTMTLGNGFSVGVESGEKLLPNGRGGVVNDSPQPQPPPPPQKIVKTSLNVTTRPVDVMKLRINTFRLAMVCAECRESLSSVPLSSSLPSLSASEILLAQHFQSFSMCQQCGFRSYCLVSFRKHTKTFHTHSDWLHYKSIDIYQNGVLICPCGYQSMHGDGLASHLCQCIYKTCYSRPRMSVKWPGKFNSNLARHRDNKIRPATERDKGTTNDQQQQRIGVNHTKNVRFKPNSKSVNYFGIVNLTKLKKISGNL